MARLAETHFTHRVGWLRAAVLGANDDIVSTASLIVGVAAAEASRSSVLVAGVAGLVAGAMSMAAGEYVSVSSQSDTESADMERERKELATDGDNDQAELAAIYVARGLDAQLAHQVATQLMAKDALGAHARGELGISDTLSARPVQAAFASAWQFHRRGCAATPIGARRAAIGPGRDGFGRLAFVPGAAGCHGGPRGRFPGVEIRRARDFLGRAGHGPDRRSGCTVSPCVSFAPTKNS